ncbi:MAG: hypothetical protein KJO19_03625, partial [Woeseia sp.]|nr:hypothetical protein [Woeseia sp.]
MKPVAFALRSFGRELRAGEMLVLLAAISLAVAALTAVGFLTDRIGKAVARQANEVLAADLRVRSPEPIPELWRALANDYQLQTAETQNFPSVVYAGDESTLAGIRAVSAGYPLRGRLRVSDKLFSEQYETDEIPAPGTVWADASLLARIGVDVGAEVSLGVSDLTVSAVLTYRPDQSIGFGSLAPTLLMNLADLPATQLISEGSRNRYALLVAGEEQDVDDFYEAIAPELPESVRVRNREDSSERAGNAADRAQRFLSLTAIISVLLSAVAIAMSARRFAQRRMDMVALMKSMGASQQFVITSVAVQLVLLAVFGVLLGSAAGFVAECGVTTMLADMFRSDLPQAGPRPI